MGWRDASRFKQKFLEIFGREFNPENPENRHMTVDVRQIQELYDKGFEDGWRGAKDYDPRWDAD